MTRFIIFMLTELCTPGMFALSSGQCAWSPKFLSFTATLHLEIHHSPSTFCFKFSFFLPFLQADREHQIRSHECKPFVFTWCVFLLLQFFKAGCSARGASHEQCLSSKKKQWKYGTHLASLPCLHVGSCWQSSDLRLSVCCLFPIAMQDCVADQGLATQCLKYVILSGKLRPKNLSQLNLQICRVWFGLWVRLRLHFVQSVSEKRRSLHQVGWGHSWKKTTY